ncbi:MAG TPA: hypothetical protein VLJ78_07185 [Microvirga sp.]|nr:hypothetical protein [Microvirga sp.]
MPDFAVSALSRKRAELAGEIEAAEVRRRELRAISPTLTLRSGCSRPTTR